MPVLFVFGKVATELSYYVLVEALNQVVALSLISDAFSLLYLTVGKCEQPSRFGSKNWDAYYHTKWT